MLSALVVSAVGYATENFFEHEAHVRGCALVNSRHRTSSLTAGINRTDVISKLRVREFLATARADHCDVCFLNSATSCTVRLDPLLPNRAVT